MKTLLIAIAIIILNPIRGQAQTKAIVQDSELKILSWNIYMLPFIVFKKSGKKERAIGIGNELAEADFDILLFQEAFKKNIRRVLRKKLGDQYPYHYGPYNQRRWSFHTNSGLYIFSRKPMLHQGDIQFEECSGSSCLARKGAVMLQGEHQGKLFQVVNTHTNGGHVINNSQFHAIYDQLLQPNHEEGIPQIIGGDLNCGRLNTLEYNEMLDIMDAEDGTTNGFTYSNWEQTDVIDYLLVRPNGSEVKIINREILAIGGETNTEIIRPARESIGLSDHYAIEIILSW